MKRVATMLLAAVATGSLLGGCGKKPGFVDAPAGVDPDPFPRMYPNPVSEGGVRSYPTPASEPGAAPGTSSPPSTDPFARISPSPATESRQ